MTHPQNVYTLLAYVLCVSKKMQQEIVLYKSFGGIKIF